MSTRIVATSILIQQCCMLCFVAITIFATSVESVFSSASYYGDSFTFERFTEFSSECSLSIQFQTGIGNGVIFAAIGQDDYLTLLLRHGRLEVQVREANEEGLLKSPAGVQYDNQLWHKVDLFKIGSRIDLRVNGKDVLSDDIFQTKYDNVLKIDLGIFLGGYDVHVVSANQFDLSLPFFRGCIFSAIFNSIDVLHPLRNIVNEKVVHNIQAGCSKILRARSSEALKLTTQYAYLKYQRWTDETEGTFECQLKTRVDQGILLFNDGWKRQAFVGLEMNAGRIRGSINSGGGVVALQSTMLVNDGTWHRVRFSFSPSLLEIRVDRNRTKVFIEHDSSDESVSSKNDIKLKGPLYVGGVELAERQSQSLLASGLQTQSFRGCLKSIRINYRRKSYSDIISSHDVVVGCKASQSDWASSLPAKPPVLPRFVIVPRQPTSTSTTVMATDKNISPTHFCYTLQVRNMSVEEGASQNVTSQIISLSVDAENFENTNNEIFAIQFVSLPRHGQLYVGREPVSRNKSYFTGIIRKNLLSYHHDDSETLKDDFSFKLINAGGINSSIEKNGIIYHFCDRESKIMDFNEVIHTVNITITSSNDLPFLEIPANFIFEPIRNAKTPLPRRIFSARDPDSLPPDILYHVLGLGTGLYIEHIQSPGRPVSSFTQQDINRGKINFVHAGGPSNTRMLIQVSNIDQDVNLAQSSTVLRVSSRPLQILIVNNTGFTLVEGEHFVFTSSQLYSTSNAGRSIVDLFYTITMQPMHGEVQLMQGSGENQVWIKTSSFLQSQLEEGKVRYVNLDATNSEPDILHERFSFTVSDCGVTIGPYICNITILKVKINLQTSPIVLKNGKYQVSLSNEFLSVRYSGLEQLNDHEIQFHVQQSFSWASLSFKDTGFVLSNRDVFTMVDVKTERILISVVEIPVDVPRLDDSMVLSALVKGRYSSAEARLNLTYIPDVTAVKLTTETLVVDEGGEILIDEDILFVETLVHQRFFFNITISPSHGQLVLVDKRANGEYVTSNPQQSTSIASFTTAHILDERLYYRHDGSETSSDVFQFEVTPILRGELPETINQLQNISIRGSLNISVNLINDNVPIRMINKPFKVVRHGQRLLTRHDLWYHDPDVDQDDLSIKFIRRGITNGDILNATTNREIFEFSQEDILKNKVLFRHKKNDFGRFVFWVKDNSGTVATGLFIVTASPAFIVIVNSSKLLVQKGMRSTLTGSNIQADTNVVGLKSDIYFRVTKPPLHGTLLLLNQSNVQEFTQEDIDASLLGYHHSGSPHTNDSLEYTVTAKSLSTSGSLQIQIYLASQQQPPVVRRNRVIVVHQSKAVTVGRSDLRVTHPDVRPRDIVFIIGNVPLHGYFMLNQTTSIDGSSVEPTLLKNVTTFTQWDINQGHVILIQSSNLTFDPVNPADNFTFDVSNRILSLSRVAGHIEIIPSTIPLKVSNFSVGEGRSRVLVSKYLDIPNRHFNDLDINLYVIKQPTNGMLESSRDPGQSLLEFSFRLARAEFVFYTHDGSDTTQDHFQLQARTSNGQESFIVTSYVSIIPDNDQAPTMENNTGLLVWINSITPLTSTELAAIDLDSPSSSLTYDILPPQNGFLALQSFPSKPIFNFTQENVNRKEIVFCHKGSNTGGFTFQVNDGRNYDNKHIFVIKARLLVISLVANKTMQVFPGILVPITPHYLMTLTNDEEPRDLNYDITDGPLHGKIVKKILRNLTEQSSDINVEYVTVKTFTQSEVNSSLIFYNQNKDTTLWSTLDSIILTVKSFPAKEMQNVFLRVNITYDAYRKFGKKSSIKTNEIASVLEGGSFSVTLAHLDASNIFNKLDDSQKQRYVLRYRIIASPMHGRLSVGDRLLSSNDSFLHRFIEESLIKYSHDGSEDPQDFFLFEAYLQHKSQASRRYRFTITDRFNISVQPVNDNPPVLITKNPHLEVVHGFVAVINSTHLRATDVDNPACDIRYEIIQTPKRGKIKVSGLVNNTFTQEDINENRLSFIQTGQDTSQTNGVVTSDAFYFSLSDGLHPPIYKLFMIKIFPVTVQLKTNPISLKQGEVAARLSSDTVPVATNGDLYQLQFQLTSKPKAGNLFIRNRQVTSFTYRELLSSEITYVMNDLSSDHDHMILTVSCNSTQYDYINVSAAINMTVKARMTSNLGLQFSSNSTQAITLDALDASELANFSSSTPVYEVVDFAKHAQILVAKRNNSHNKDLGGRYRHPVRRDVVQRFSHDDIRFGHVFLRVDSVNFENVSSVSDHFVYRLGVSDGSVQPARGVFEFQIVSRNITNPIFQPAMVTDYSTLSWEVLNTTANISLSTSFTPYTSSHVSTIFTSARMTTTLPVRNVKDSFEKVCKLDTEKPQASSLSWLVPVIIAIALFIIIVIAFICYCIIRSKRRKRSFYIRGHESSTLKASSIILTSPEYQQSTIDADTIVKVTSSRDDMLEVPQQCPTASVVVTPLRKSPAIPPEDLEEEDFVDGYYGDEHMSNSLPADNLLSSAGMHGLSVPRAADVTMPSPYGLGDLPPEALGQLDHYNSLPRSSSRHPALSSDDSIDSADIFEPPHPRRNVSSGSLPLTNKQLSTPALELNQYWV